MSDPCLREDDMRAWDAWCLAADAHARTLAFRHRLDAAKAVTGDALRIRRPDEACLMWSGGKDSTVMVHLVCVELGYRVAVGSEKDDLDFPGEEEYVRRLARGWSLDLCVLHPPESPEAWLLERGASMGDCEEIHARGSELSERFFYPVVEGFSSRYDLVFLGLRAEESRGRKMNRAKRGALYRKKSGQWVCNPLSDWRGLDVLAYAVSRGIELLPMYRCIGLMHRAEPWRLRKSWWLPGAHPDQAAWLRRYYPSLWARVCTAVPAARRMA